MRKLVKDLALFHWRGDRRVFFDTALLNRSLARTSEDASLGEPQDIMNGRAARAFADMSHDEALSLLSRYETRFHRMYHRTLKAILDLQDRAASLSRDSHGALSKRNLRSASRTPRPRHLLEPRGRAQSTHIPASRFWLLPPANSVLPSELPPPSPDRMWLIDKRTGACFPLDRAA